jgi:plasmid stability protein
MEAMSTIQIRNIPEPVYEEIRRRARARHQSIQQFMLAEVHRMVQRADKEELVHRIEQFKARAGIEVDVEQMLADLEADRR